jgi:hypothetical protein
MPKAAHLHIHGIVEIPEDCKPYHTPGNSKTIDGFILPDGRIVRPMMVLEIEDNGNFSEPNSTELENLGIRGAEEIDHRDVIIVNF